MANAIQFARPIAALSPTTREKGDDARRRDSAPSTANTHMVTRYSAGVSHGRPAHRAVGSPCENDVAPLDPASRPRRCSDVSRHASMPASRTLIAVIRDGLNANIDAVFDDVRQLQRGRKLSRFIFRALINRYCRSVSDVEYNEICVVWGLQREFEFDVVYEKYIKESESTATARDADVAVVHGDSETFAGTPTVRCCCF